MDAKKTYLISFVYFGVRRAVRKFSLASRSSQLDKAHTNEINNDSHPGLYVNCDRCTIKEDGGDLHECSITLKKQDCLNTSASTKVVYG